MKESPQMEYVDIRFSTIEKICGNEAIDTLLWLHLCVCATTGKPLRAIAKGVLLVGCSRIIPIFYVVSP
jgi:hypothetical protein